MGWQTRKRNIFLPIPALVIEFHLYENRGAAHPPIFASQMRAIAEKCFPLEGQTLYLGFLTKAIIMVKATKNAVNREKTSMNAITTA